MTEDEMVGWHRSLHGHEQALRVGDEQGSLGAQSMQSQRVRDN